MSEHRALARLRETRGISAVEAWLNQVPSNASSSGRDTAARLVAADLLLKDGLGATLAWISAREDPAQVTSAASTIAVAYAEKSAPQAVEWLAGLAKQHPNHGFPIHSALEKWTQQDPQSAGQWLNGYLQEHSAEKSSRLIAAYAMGIALDDPEAARQWAQKLPKTPQPQPTAATHNANGNFGGAWDYNSTDPYTQDGLLEQIQLAEQAKLFWE